jgi:hypothetical protein
VRASAYSIGRNIFRGVVAWEGGGGRGREKEENLFHQHLFYEIVCFFSLPASTSFVPAIFGAHRLEIFVFTGEYVC